MHSSCDSLWGPAPHIRLTRSSSTPSGLPHATPHSCMSARREPGQRSAQATRTISSASLHMPRNSSIRAGESLGDSELIRQTHNSFAAPHSFLSEEARAAKEEDDVFHFISYLPATGRLWELDGLKPGPIDLGPCSEVRPSVRGLVFSIWDVCEGRAFLSLPQPPSAPAAELLRAGKWSYVILALRRGFVVLRLQLREVCMQRLLANDIDLRPDADISSHFAPIAGPLWF